MLVLDFIVYLGIIAAGVSGALVGIKKQMDIFGVVSLCVATSLGGGIIRDVLVGRIPPIAFANPSLISVSVCAGIITWYFYGRINKLTRFISITDAIGLGAFTAVGANTAITLFPDELFLVLFMGLITGIGGGVVRDLLAQEIPYVFRKEIYAFASIIGAVCFIVCYKLLTPGIALYACLSVTFILRLIAIIMKLNMPILTAEEEGK